MDKTLRTRGISAILFAIVIFTLILSHPANQLLLLLIVSLGSTYELLKMARYPKRTNYLTLLVIATAYIATYISDIPEHLVLLFNFIIVATYTGLAMAILLFKKGYTKLLPFVGLLYPGAFGLIIITDLKTKPEQSTIIFIVTFLLIWANDSFAYLVGRKIGKRPLNTAISPNKTIEGFYGGGLFTIIATIIMSQYITTFNTFEWFGLGITIWLTSVIGDLVQSGFKRYYGIKDSGNILPGHGGFFDRCDSFIFTLPYVYLIITFL